MNTMLVTRPGSAPRVRTDAPPSACQVLAAWRVLPGAVMLLGRAAGGVPPAVGAVQLRSAPVSRGEFRSVSWPMRRAEDGAGGGYVFLAAVRLTGRTDPADGAVLEVRRGGVADGEPDMALQLSAPPVNGPVFGQQVARMTAGAGAQHRGTVARFMLDALRPPPGCDPGSVPAAAKTVLLAFLSQAAQPDGCVEIMAAVSDGCVLLQGWGAPIAGPVLAVLVGKAGLAYVAGHAGDFPRTDIAPPATGTLVTLPADAASALPGVEHLFVLSDKGLHSRTLVEHRLLDEAASLGHIRHLLDTAGPRCGQVVQAALQDTLRTRYEGHDTLGGHPHPVRAAIDFAVAAPGVGAYLAGWVFDPRGLVSELHLRGSKGFSARLDTSWTRVLRPDIAEAFRTAPGFPPAPDAEAGFAASTAGAPVPDEALYLQFTFTDGDRAFLPVAAGDPALPAVRTRLLAGVDLYKPSGPVVIEKHLAPLLARVRHSPPSSAATQVVLQGPVERKHAVVVPLAAPVLPRAFLSGFLHDPLDRDEHLLLACGPEWAQPALDALRTLVGFYGLPATILKLPETAGPVAAMRAAAGRCPPGTGGLLLAEPGVSGRAAGWRQALRDAGATRKDAAWVCPTLLYEDWSVRYAGSAELRFLDAAPYVQALAPLAGMPGVLAGSGAPVPAALGTLACCLVRRPALAALEDRTGALGTDAAREAAFFLGLRAAGQEGLWAPSVQVYAPEGADAAQEDRARAAARLADGWVLRQAWQPQPSHRRREGEA